MWRYIGNGEHIGGGVPPRDMEDDEFDEVNAAYDLQFPDQPGALKTCGLYEQANQPAARGQAEPVTLPTPDAAGTTEEVSDEHTA